MRAISLLLFATPVVLSGCASIVSGQVQSLSVETQDDAGSVVGAVCTLENDKGKWLITTPGNAGVQRSFSDLSIKCEKGQFAPGIAFAKSSTKGMAFGNILFGGIIGVGVDIATGAAYDYASMIMVTMGKSSIIEGPAMAAQTPSGAGGRCARSSSGTSDRPYYCDTVQPAASPQPQR